MINAMNVNKSGNIANGPRPKALKLKVECTSGLEERAQKSKTIENINNPIVNSDFVFLYMSMYMIDRQTRRAMFIEENASNTFSRLQDAQSA